MAQATDITVFDGAATPVSHTLVHEGTSKSADNSTITMEWAERKAGLPLEAQVRLVGTKTRLKGPKGIHRLSIRVIVPVMESINGQNAQGYTASPAVAYTDEDEYIKYVHPRSTTESRRLSRQLTVNAVNGVATSVAPNTTSQIPLLFDQLLAAT